LHHLSTHPSALIVVFYVIAMNPLPCTVLVDTLSLAWVGGEDRTIEFMQREGRKSFKTPLLVDHTDDKGIIKHPFPMNLFLKPWRLSHWFYQVVKFGIVQYMIIKSLTALTALILEAFGVYCEGEFKWSCGYPYLAVVLNFSQSWALYCLVQFYGATKDELAHIKPLAKFLTFKSIVFLTWWQGVAIALLSSLGLFKSSIAQSLQLKTSVQDFIICIEMGIASVVHLYVFPAKPYGLLGDRFTGSVSVLGDYASVDCPIDPDEIRDSERRTKVRLPHPDVDIRSCMTIKESMRDVFVGGGEYIVKDVRFTVTQAVEPMEKSITKFNEKLHKISQNIKKHDKDKRRVKDDSCMSSSSSRRVIRGIDDPLLNGSFSDSGVTRTKKHRQKSGYTSGGSGGESSSDQAYSGFEIVKDVRFTVTQAVEPMEKSITKFNEKLHKISQNIKKHDKDKRRVKDDSCMSSSSSRRVIRGIDDPLLNGSFSDSGVTRTKKHRRKSGYTSGGSGGESSSDQAYSGFEVAEKQNIQKGRSMTPGHGRLEILAVSVHAEGDTSMDHYDEHDDMALQTNKPLLPIETETDPAVIY
ncbi:hypothetical protein F2Q69_00032630, partial [Brassica cretica]